MLTLAAGTLQAADRLDGRFYTDIRPERLVTPCEPFAADYVRPPKILFLIPGRIGPREVSELKQRFNFTFDAVLYQGSWGINALGDNSMYIDPVSGCRQEEKLEKLNRLLEQDQWDVIVFGHNTSFAGLSPRAQAGVLKQVADGAGLVILQSNAKLSGTKFPKEFEVGYAELFFPYSVLGRTPKPGDLWRFAICRFDYTGKGLFAVSAPGAKYSNPGAFGWLYFLSDAQTDPVKLGNSLKDRIGGDWILPAGEKAISKSGNTVSLVALADPLVSGKKEAEAALAECRKQTPAGADTAKLEELAAGIQALPASVSDPAEFGSAMLKLASLKQDLEDYLYTRRLDELVRTNAPKPLPTPTPAPKPTPRPKPAASPAAAK